MSSTLGLARNKVNGFFLFFKLSSLFSFLFLIYFLCSLFYLLLLSLSLSLSLSLFLSFFLSLKSFFPFFLCSFFIGSSMRPMVTKSGREGVIFLVISLLFPFSCIFSTVYILSNVKQQEVTQRNEEQREAIRSNIRQREE